MGKLTYSARKISGVKAGQVVSKDVKKRIPPGSSAKAAMRDPTLEIDVAGKCLTDEGFAQFVDDLIECIQYRDDGHRTGAAKVTELHLQDNELTAQSLFKLGKIIALSPGDIREVDLSGNKIRVDSHVEKELWKGFLDSFKDCYMLKKLDLSGNPLGAAGLETLACVYMKSDLDYIEADANTFIESTTSDEMSSLVEGLGTVNIEDGKENANPRPLRSKKSPNKGKAVKQNGNSQSTGGAASKALPPTDLKRYACARGIRSIPFLILSNIDITNSSAVHLSSMISIQRDPEQLLEFLPPSKAINIPSTARGCKSIIWQPNNGLASFATRLLEVAQAVQEVRAEFDSESDDFDEDENVTQRKLQSKLELEYARLTKRVRLEFLKQEGIQRSEIGYTALRMMNVARALLLDDNDRADSSSADEIAEVEVPRVERIMSRQADSGDDDSDEARPYSEHIEYVPPYLHGPFHPNAIMFDEEFPALHMTITREEIVDIQEKASSSANVPTRAGKGLPRHATAPRETQKEVWRFGLPYEIWRRIIAEAVGADSLLDSEQQARIINYATDWNVVAYEMTIKGAELHQQIWKFLETVGCFTYSTML